MPMRRKRTSRKDAAAGERSDPRAPTPSGKLRRALMRNIVFTIGPDRLTRGMLSRAHLRHGILVREIEVVSPRWPRPFDGLRIGHFSDLHVGSMIPLERGLEAVSLLAAEQPDLVVCTGDVVDLHAIAVEPIFRAMAGIRSPLGAAFVLGNHDELDDPRLVARMAADAGVLVLDDTTLEIRRHGTPLRIAGIGWAKTVAECATKVDQAGGREADLLLAHNPRAFRRAIEHGIPLTLSGHTHGGQVALPGRPTASLAIGHRYRAGLYEQMHSRLYVTTGVGAWFPLRVNCPPEVAIITMRSSEGEREGGGIRP